MKGFMTTLRRLALATVMCLPLTACGVSSGPIDGTIIDEATGKPIADAIVLVTWEGSIPAVVEQHRVCVHVMSTITDGQGRYHFDGWSKKANFGPVPVTVLQPLLFAYKPGYEWSDRPSEADSNKLYLALSKATGDERAAFLFRVLDNSRCNTRDSSEKNRLPLLQSVEREAGTLIQAKDKQRLLEAILFEKEVAQFGDEEAQRRYLERTPKGAK